MRKLLFIVSIVAACYFGLTQYRHPSVSNSQVSGIEATGDAEFAKALENRSSGVQIQGQGIVTKVLPDDNEGSRHQRFIVKLGSGQTLLVAHNIDIASRVSSLRVGDTVAFGGVYEWNPQGGVIHWTHHDPSGGHAAGWLKHGSKTYQ
jgi:hypothetical protein